MASDDKKTKADAFQKPRLIRLRERCSEKRQGPGDAKSNCGCGDRWMKEHRGCSPSHGRGGEREAGSPSGYHRGEGQKPVTQAYKATGT